MRLLVVALAFVTAILLKQDTPAAVFPFNQKYVSTFFNDAPFVGIVRYREWEGRAFLPLQSRLARLRAAAATTDAMVSVFGG
jgi:hypothetical protein